MCWNGDEPFTSLDDLFRRVHLSPEGWDNLARSGALDAFGARRKLLWHLERLARLTGTVGEKSKQLSMLDSVLPPDLPAEEVLAFPLTPAETLIWDFSTHGPTTGPHPMALRRPDMARLGVRPVEELFTIKTSSKVLTAGLIAIKQKPPTANGMCFLAIEDESGRIQGAIPPPTYAKFERLVQEPMLLVEGRVEATPEQQIGKREGTYRTLRDCWANQRWGNW